MQNVSYAVPVLITAQNQPYAIHSAQENEVLLFK